MTWLKAALFSLVYVVQVPGFLVGALVGLLEFLIFVPATFARRVVVNKTLLFTMWTIDVKIEEKSKETKKVNHSRR